MAYVICPLGPEVDRTAFACGETALDDYLQRHASQDIKRGVARVFVASPADQQLIAGYYTLSAASVAAQTLPEAWRKKLPRYPVPVALLGRLAVSQQAQGAGLGGILLADACKRVAAASQTLAVAAIVVDAKNERAASFYKHFGFTELPGQPGRWMLPKSQFA
jgi:ribosomal protein S18 acetylase RimI-like enzyme